MKTTSLHTFMTKQQLHSTNNSFLG